MSVAAVDRFVERLISRGDAEAVVEGARTSRYCDLVAASERWMAMLHANRVTAGTVCGYIGDYGIDSVALFIALMRVGAIAVPLTRSVANELPQLIQIASVQRLIRLEKDNAEIAQSNVSSSNGLIEQFRRVGHAGLVVFTSGSSGQPKGILHDMERILEKFAQERAGLRTVMFLLMDHFGGVNTLLSVLAYGGTAICLGQRSPEAVCRAIAESRAELLPTTPTFLNMLLISGAWRHCDMSSVRFITYGTEPMPEAVLRRVRDVFPQAAIKQTYGLSEVGVLRSQSPDPSSLWVRIGGDGFETRVVDGILHIRSRSSMVGYLNAPSPIDADGWMNTGDLVEEDGELIRFVGRASEIINVAGQKVFPSEVEAALLEADNVTEAVVFGIRHPLLGQAVRARVSLARPEDPAPLSERLREHCLGRLAKFKVPLRFDISVLGSQVTERAKKRRS